MSIILKTISQGADDFFKICSKYKSFVTNNSLKTKPFYNFAQETIGDVVEIAGKKAHCTKPYNLSKEVLEKYIAEGKGTAEIAEDFGCSRTTVNVYLRKFGLGLKQTVEISDDVLRAQVAEGMSLPQMAKANNCSQSTVRDRMKALGLRTLEAERAANISKEELERLIQKGWICRDIARKYKITEMQAGRLLKELNLETETDKIIKMITKQDILDMYEAGANYSMLPEIFGVPEFVIYKLIKDFNLADASHKMTRFMSDSVDVSFEMLDKMVKEGLTKAQIAEEIGASVQTVSKYLDNYGILPIQRQAKTVLPDNFSLSQMLKKGATLKEIAEDYDISIEALKNHLKKAGILGYTPKKTPYESIADLLKEGYSVREISEKLGIPLNRVRSEIKLQGLTIKIPKERFLSGYKEWLISSLNNPENAQELKLYFGLSSSECRRLYGCYYDEIQKIYQEVTREFRKS